MSCKQTLPGHRKLGSASSSVMDTACIWPLLDQNESEPKLRLLLQTRMLLAFVTWLSTHALACVAFC